MSLPPYKHIRNPALEREDEFYEHKSSKAPLITFNGIVERRKTADLKLIRSQPPHPGIEFEYLPSIKNSISENRMKARFFDSGNERKDNKSEPKDNRIENTIISETRNCAAKTGGQDEDARSTRSRRSIEISASHESLNSRMCGKSASTEISETSTINEILGKPSDSLKLSYGQTRAFILQSRNLANGLDEDDRHPYACRR